MPLWYVLARMRTALFLVVVSAVMACGKEKVQAVLPDEEDAGFDAGVEVDAGPTYVWDAGVVDAGPPLKGPPYPIVFLHGMAGWGNSGPLDYFNGVGDALTGAGETDIFFTAVSPYTSSADRAAQLSPQLEAIFAATHAEKINLVAHSQGGLDARLLASPAGLGYGDRIASITTVSTPHYGTKVADLVIPALGDDAPTVVDPVVEAVVALLGFGIYDLNNQDRTNLRTQLLDLSTDGAAQFNALYVDAPGVIYESYAGRTNLRTGRDACRNSVIDNDPWDLDPTNPALQLTATYLEGNPFDPDVNDGLVPVESARYGTFVQCIAADHLDEMGMNAGILFNAPDFYVKVVQRIRARGQ